MTSNRSKTKAFFRSSSLQISKKRFLQINTWQIVSHRRIYYCPTPINLRKSFDGLAGAVEEYIKQDPESGHVFAFFSHNKKLIKSLQWEDEDDGFVIWMKARTGRFLYSSIRWRPDRIDQSRTVGDSIRNQIATLLQKILGKVLTEVEFKVESGIFLSWYYRKLQCWLDAYFSNARLCRQ